MEKMPEKLPLAGNAAAGTEGDWSTLVGRAIDDVSRIIQSEIGLFETTLRAAVEEQTDYALANLATVAVMICATICMLGALILLPPPMAPVVAGLCDRGTRGVCCWNRDPCNGRPASCGSGDAYQRPAGKIADGKA